VQTRNNGLCGILYPCITILFNTKKKFLVSNTVFSLHAPLCCIFGLDFDYIILQRLNQCLLRNSCSVMFPTSIKTGQQCQSESDQAIKRTKAGVMGVFKILLTEALYGARAYICLTGEPNFKRALRLGLLFEVLSEHGGGHRYARALGVVLGGDPPPLPDYASEAEREVETHALAEINQSIIDTERDMNNGHPSDSDMFAQIIRSVFSDQTSDTSSTTNSDENENDKMDLDSEINVVAETLDKASIHDQQPTNTCATLGSLSHDATTANEVADNVSSTLDSDTQTEQDEEDEVIGQLIVSEYNKMDEIASSWVPVTDLEQMILYPLLQRCLNMPGSDVEMMGL
jgi:hypothetical protein